MSQPIKVTVWGEYRHEKKNPKVSAIYPQGMHQAIAGFLRAESDMEVHTATLDEPEHGLTDSVLNDTDVLIWWGHLAHREVQDDIVARVQRRVLEGMGLLVLHSGHHSKIFRALMGTTCSLKWREATDKERIWNICPSHPIAVGLGDYFEIPAEEMYGEPLAFPLLTNLFSSRGSPVGKFFAAVPRGGAAMAGFSISDRGMKPIRLITCRRCSGLLSTAFVGPVRPFAFLMPARKRFHLILCRKASITTLS